MIFTHVFNYWLNSDGIMIQEHNNNNYIDNVKIDKYITMAYICMISYNQ